uniref:Uncharacterized protein n=1 Tax=Lactuca sativa TaxID=4236 RepID=A0A9R1X004_LACSA|nr:hypothetical protein LSAT_V11C800442320 [Lactuca sativa]
MIRLNGVGVSNLLASSPAIQEHRPQALARRVATHASLQIWREEGETEGAIQLVKNPPNLHHKTTQSHLHLGGVLTFGSIDPAFTAKSGGRSVVRRSVLPQINRHLVRLHQESITQGNFWVIYKNQYLDQPTGCTTADQWIQLWVWWLGVVVVFILCTWA